MGVTDYDEKLHRRWLGMAVTNEDLNRVIAQIIERFDAIEARLDELEEPPSPATIMATKAAKTAK